MAWKQGPLPPDTYGWGAVVPFDMRGEGFLFADFWGDHVECYPSGRVLRADEVRLYDNSIEQPPKSVSSKSAPGGG